MNAENVKNNDSEKSAVQILQEINSGQFDPRLLDSEGRKCCVEALMGEGYTISHMAQVLKRNEKTIRRDLKEIRAQHALSPSQKFTKELVGELVAKALHHSGYLMRIARSKDALPGEKSQAEFAAWKVIKELVEKLQTLGYLPQMFDSTSTGNGLGSEKQSNVSAQDNPSVSGTNGEVLEVVKAMDPMDRERMIERLTWIMTGHPNGARFIEHVTEPGEVTKWLSSSESDPA